MIEINLLPKEMRKARGLTIPKPVMISAGAVVGIVLILAALTVVQAVRLNRMDSRIADVRRQADKMREDIQLVDRLVEVKTKVLDRLSAIETLDFRREKWVRIVDELSSRVPEFLWLTAFSPTKAPGAKKAAGAQTPGQVAEADSAVVQKHYLKIEGYSFTLNGLANFLIELQASDYFDDLKLNYARTVDVEKQYVYNFSLSCQLEDLVARDDAGEVEDVGGQGLAEDNYPKTLAADH